MLLTPLTYIYIILILTSSTSITLQLYIGVELPWLISDDC